MIDIEKVDIVKQGHTLYESFSWRIEHGENWLITGSNGSGKSILLEMLSGMMHIPKGEIHYDFIKGFIWDVRYAEKKNLITYIPAHALRSFVDGNNLFYQQRYYGMGDSRTPLVRDVLGEPLEQMGEHHIPLSLSIRHLLNVELSRLSNGQLKKLLLLKSFLKGVPKLLLLDYPLEGLDYESREDLCRFIDLIAEQYKIQIIIVDHQFHLPRCINRHLKLENFKIVKSERYGAGVHKMKENISHELTQSQFSDGDLPTLIEIKNLKLKYGSYEVFRNFNWTVRKGERWALTGRNGAGKTTLFSLIFADHPQAYAQEIYLFGRRRGSGESIWDIKRRINYLGPEQASFLDSNSATLSGREYIRSVNAGRAGGALDGIIRYFDVDSFIDKPVRTFSSGQLQLLMILACFMSEKELWLLDEPFQFLDPIQKDRLSKYLLTHLSSEITLILITHSAQDLATWTDKRMQL